ncbi:MAG TPA: FAD-binding oxidoreductase [Bacillota bacterium]|nr:FAD-binding oxidoreductase [Bacillota bacterium]
MMDASFLCGLSGSIVTPCDDSYNEDRQGWNRAVQHYPLVINYCRTSEDVSNAVMWAMRNHVELRIRGGGHNYEGYSNGNCVLVIDVSKMKNMELDQQSHTVCVQGGVTNRELYEYIASKGYPFPGGTCPTVGVSGYALGGGWGLSCRYFGLGCDSIEEITLVNYEGQIIKANSRYNEDLFWACRGAGGGNFGIIISITFKLPPPIQNVTLIEIDYLHSDAQTQKLFLQTWQTWLCHADQRLTLISRIYNSDVDGLSMLVRGIFYGEPEEAACLVQSFLNLQGAVSDIQYVTFLEAVTILGSSYPDFEKFQSASRFVYRQFSPCEISDIAALIQNRPDGSVYTGLSMYALGGKVAETDVNNTAFFHRNAHYIIWIETIWEDSRFACVNSAWINQQFQCLVPLTTGSYVNFPYDGLCCYKSEYYGCHVECLKEIKQKYDPYNVFTFPQGLESCGKYNIDNIGLPEEHTQRQADGLPVKSSGGNHRGFRYVNSTD